MKKNITKAELAAMLDGGEYYEIEDEIDKIIDMKKNITKEELADMLDGGEYYEIGDEIDKIIEAAKKNNLVIIHGTHCNRLELHGAICDEVRAGSVLRLTRKGVHEGNDCGDDCLYYRQWLKDASKRGEIRKIRVFRHGVSGRKTMERSKYAALGMPKWCFETSMSHAEFSIYDTDDDRRDNRREYFCHGIVIDLNEVFGLPATTHKS